MDIVDCRPVPGLTQFERNVIIEVGDGCDPYRTLVTHGTRTRSAVTRALRSLVRKGYVVLRSEVGGESGPGFDWYELSWYGRDFCRALDKIRGRD